MRGPLERIAWRIGVFSLSSTIALAAYRPLRRLPMVNSDNLRIIHRAQRAGWGDLMLGRIDWDVSFTGREFRPLPVALYRLDDVFVSGLAPGHRLFAILWVALVAVAAFATTELISGPLGRFEATLAAVLCASLPATLAGSEPAGLPTMTYMSLTALILLVLVATLVRLLPAYAPDGRAPARPARPLLALGLTVFAAGLCVEFAPIQAALLVALFGGLTLWLRRDNWPIVARAALAAAAGLIAFYAYKAASGGTSQLFLPGKKYGISGVGWEVGPIDRTLASLSAHVGFATVYGPANAVRNVISTGVPLFAEYGGFTSHRLPFLLPHVILGGIVLAGLVRLPGRQRLTLATLAVAAAIVSGSVYTAHRPRWIFPGLAVWTLTLAVAAIWWLRSSPQGKVLTYRLAFAACVAALVAVNFGLAYHAALQLTVYDYAATYSNAPLDKPVYTRLLESLRASYRCRLLSDYESFARRHGPGESMADLIYGLPVSRSPLPPDESLTRIARACRRPA